MATDTDNNDDKKESTGSKKQEFSIDDFDPFLQQVPMVPCLEIDKAIVFNVGFKPIVLSTLSACLGPIKIIEDLLNLAAKPPKFIKKLVLLSPPAIPVLCLDFFKTASISFGMPPIKIKLPAPFSLEAELGNPKIPKLDIKLQIDSYIEFIINLLLIPIKIIIELMKKISKFDFNINIKNIVIEVIALSIQPNFISIDANLESVGLPKLSVKFADCLTQIVLAVFEPLINALGGATDARKGAIKEPSDNALALHKDNKDTEALKIINKNRISPDDFISATGESAAFYRLKDTEEFETELV